MSFALTTDQILARTKTVTRRLGWEFVQAGDLIQAIEKGQGLKKGEKARKLAVLRVESVRREPLDAIAWPDDVVREGFPHMTAWQFIEMFCKSHRVSERYQEGGVLSPFVNGWRKCTPRDIVTRIEFSYVEGAQ